VYCNYKHRMAVETTQVDHPYDPLTPKEIETARDILEREREIGGGFRYVKIVLEEPSKKEIKSFETASGSVNREAFIILRDRNKRQPTKRLSHCLLTRSSLGKKNRTFNRRLHSPSSMSVKRQSKVMKNGDTPRRNAVLRSLILPSSIRGRSATISYPAT